jgi:DNA-binding transcriptional LysR family regulator
MVFSFRKNLWPVHATEPLAAMKMRDLDYVMAAAAAGNLTGAARSLGISTSTVSRRISRIEDELGLAVFERGHKGVRLTTGGRAVLLHARRAAAELEAFRLAAQRNGTGAVGEVRLGLRMVPISQPMLDLLAGWRQSCADVLLTISEMNERDLAIALDERRVDAALAPAWVVSRRAAALPVYRERLFAALPGRHALAGRERVTWPAFAGETVLVQGWDESQAERDFVAPLIGAEANLRSHAASKLSILALVAAGFGVTIVAQSQAEAGFPGVAFLQIDEPDALLQVDLAWMPEAEEPALGRFVAFIRDAARSRGLV